MQNQYTLIRIEVNFNLLKVHIQIIMRDRIRVEICFLYLWHQNENSYIFQLKLLKFFKPFSNCIFSKYILMTAETFHISVIYHIFNISLKYCPALHHLFASNFSIENHILSIYPIHAMRLFMNIVHKYSCRNLFLIHFPWDRWPHICTLLINMHHF